MLTNNWRQEHVQKRKWMMLLVWISFAIISRFIKFGFETGSHEAHLTAGSFVFPIVGYLFTFPVACLSAACAWFIVQSMASTSMAMGLPTLCAIISWAFSKKEKKMQFLYHVALPIFFIWVFCNVTPMSAWPYSLYWTIPIALHFLPTNLLFRALQSTFMAHAAGSVIWAYRFSMSGDQWIALVPIVAIERLLYAFLSLGVIGFFLFLGSAFNKEALAHKNLF